MFGVRRRNPLADKTRFSLTVTDFGGSSRLTLEKRLFRQVHSHVFVCSACLLVSRSRNKDFAITCFSKRIRSHRIPECTWGRLYIPPPDGQDFPDCHYITVSSPSGGVGGFKSVNFNAFRTRRVRAASADPATFRSIVHAKRHQAYRLERLHRPLRREVDPRLLKPAIQEPLHQQRQGGHEDMCLHSRLYLMIYRPHRQHVLELTKPPFDVAQVLVDRHHLEYAQTQLAGRDHIFTFDPLFAPQACRVLEVPEAPLVDLPGIVAVAMAPLQQPLGRGADLLGLLQLAGRYCAAAVSPTPAASAPSTSPAWPPRRRGRSSESTMITLMPAIPEGTS